MSVLVIGRNGRALMPTNPRKARLLLKKKTASVVLNFKKKEGGCKN